MTIIMLISKHETLMEQTHIKVGSKERAKKTMSPPPPIPS